MCIRDRHTILQVRAREVFHFDVETILALPVLAVGAHERVVGTIEHAEHAVVQRKPGPEDSGQYGLLGQHRGMGDPQGSGHLTFHILQRAAQFMGEDLSLIHI